MSEYTSTREGFQRAMEWSLTGPPGEAQKYGERTSTQNFYHIMNDQRLEFKDYVKGISEWRAKVSDYAPVIHEFLRDGNQLAARMTGTIKVDGHEMKFESFMFAKIEEASGKMESLIERSIWGPIDGPPEHGAD